MASEGANGTGLGAHGESAVAVVSKRRSVRRDILAGICGWAMFMDWYLGRYFDPQIRYPTL